MFYKNKQKGFGLLEIIIGLAAISFSLFGILSVSQVSLQIINNDTQKLKADFLAEEGMEAVRILRDFSWNNNIKPLTPDNDYYLYFNGNTWQSTTTPVYIDGFERKFVLSDVYRDGNDDIASGGNLDPDTKKITIFVSWQRRNSTTTDIISTYLTNLFKN